MNDGILTGLREAVELLRELEGLLPDFGGAVRVEASEERLDLILDHPSARHALTAKMMRELAEGAASAAARPPAWLVLRSSDTNSFCAGGHLGQVRAGLLEAEAGSLMTRAMSRVTAALAGLPSISVALLDGPAVGGGVELAMSCDLRLMHSNAWLHPAQAALGVVNGWGGAASWARNLSVADALLLLAQARRIPASEARELGLVQYVGDEKREDLLRAGLGDAALREPNVLRALKAQLRASSREDENRHFLSVWGGQAHLRALAR